MTEEKNYLIVNPKGIMHVVSESHARSRLKIVGWRLANADERAAYFNAKGNQRFDKPLAAPFSPQPLTDQALTEAELMPTKKSEPEPGEQAEQVETQDAPKPKGKVKSVSQPSD